MDSTRIFFSGFFCFTPYVFKKCDLLLSDITLTSFPCLRSAGLGFGVLQLCHCAGYPCVDACSVCLFLVLWFVHLNYWRLSRIQVLSISLFNGGLWHQQVNVHHFILLVYGKCSPFSVYSPHVFLRGLTSCSLAHLAFFTLCTLSRSPTTRKLAQASHIHWWHYSVAGHLLIDESIHS